MKEGNEASKTESRGAGVGWVWGVIMNVIIEGCHYECHNGGLSL